MVFTGSSGFPGIIWSRAPLSTTTVQVCKVQQSAVGPVRAEGTGGTPCEFALEEHCLVQLHRGYDEACWEPSTDPWPSRKSEAQLQQYSQEKPLRATGADRGSHSGQTIVHPRSQASQCQGPSSDLAVNIPILFQGTLGISGCRDGPDR